jgi:branched-chain amino acid transport system ATP-binding protein
MTGPPVLQARGVTRSFGGLTAVEDVDLAVSAGQMALVIGPNGAGKTTLFNCLSGVLRPDRGSVLIAGADLTGRQAHEYAVAGVSRTFQHARTFAGLDVLSNVMVGAHHRLRAGWLRGALRLPWVRAEERAVRGRAMAVLEDLDLAHRATAPVGDLTLHEERRLELARCLIADPLVVLLDEPFAGLGDQEARELAAQVDAVRRERDLAVVLIEHHVDLALELADQVTVLDFGRVIAEGPPAAVRTDPAVVAAYMGVA